MRERSIYLCFCVASHICGFCYWYEIPGQAGDDIVGQAGDDIVGQAGDDIVGQAGDDMLLHAELVDAAVSVCLAWAEEG